MKLTEPQRAVLKRLAVGPYYPAGRHLLSAYALKARKLATFYRPTLCFQITPAGRAALQSTNGHRGEVDG